MSHAADKSLLVQQLSAAMEALSSVIGQHIEVVLHDVSQPTSSVVKIINGHISGRETGHSILSGPDDDQGRSSILKIHLFLWCSRITRQRVRKVNCCAVQP